MRMSRLHASLTFVLLLSSVSGASPQDADAARRWRLHCVAVGGDLSEPAGILLFRRCLAEAPAGAAAQDAAPIVNPFAKDPLVVTKTPVPLANTCPEGLMRRDAAPDDRLCVPAAVRERTLRENAAALSRTVPGSDRCLNGFVWREATKSDHVCVEPAVRAAVARDNAAARN
jgi:hypothetical protein